MRRDRERLQDILEALDAIKTGVDSSNKEAFLNGPTAFGAAAYHLTIVGEAVNRLSPALKEQNSSILWRDIVSLRNLLIHVYFGIDRVLVWKVVTVDCPALRSHVERILEAMAD